jgi:hypothetical protein
VDDDDAFLNEGADSKVFDPSVSMYPQPYCSIVDQVTILSISVSDGKFPDKFFSLHFEQSTSKKFFF